MSTRHWECGCNNTPLLTVTIDDGKDTEEHMLKLCEHCKLSNDYLASPTCDHSLFPRIIRQGEKAEPRHTISDSTGKVVNLDEKRRGQRRNGAGTTTNPGSKRKAGRG